MHFQCATKCIYLIIIYKNLILPFVIWWRSLFPVRSWMLREAGKLVKLHFFLMENWQLRKCKTPNIPQFRVVFEWTSIKEINPACQPKAQVTINKISWKHSHLKIENIALNLLFYNVIKRGRGPHNGKGDNPSPRYQIFFFFVCSLMANQISHNCSALFFILRDMVLIIYQDIA